MKKYLFTITKNYINHKQLINNLNQLQYNDQNTHYEIRTFDNTLLELKLIEKKDLNNYDQIVIINSDGIFPFMYLSKINKIVAASLYDENSAYMASFHNNAKIMCSGYEVCSIELLTSIIKVFLNTKFEGGRHLARIDMLNEMLEGN